MRGFVNFDNYRISFDPSKYENDTKHVLIKKVLMDWFDPKNFNFQITKVNEHTSNFSLCNLQDKLYGIMVVDNDMFGPSLDLLTLDAFEQWVDLNIEGIKVVMLKPKKTRRKKRKRKYDNKCSKCSCETVTVIKPIWSY